MDFPIIKTLSDIHPYNTSSKYFKHYEDPENNLLSICYNQLVDKEQFITPIQRELRGIKFNLTTGEVLARPFHKFFNKGEVPNEEPSSLDFKVYEKLDGSMIHPVITNKGLRLCTKSGITDISLLAEDLLSTRLNHYLEELLLSKQTPIMEYISPFNIIVIPYKVAELHLLAVRDTITGQYYDINNYRYLGLPLVREADIEIKDIKARIGEEGYVLVYSDGYRLKIKTEDYILKSKFVKGFYTEVNILKLILEGSLDDVREYLLPEQLESIEQYKQQLTLNIEVHSSKLLDIIDSNKDKSRKEVSLLIQSRLEKEEHPLFWNLYSNKEVVETYLSFISKHLKSSKLELIRWLLPNFNI